MSDIKSLNNRLDSVERQRFELEQRNTELQQQLATARAEANYYRRECRTLLAVRGNALNGITEALTSRLAAHRRDAVPGDRIAAAAVIECRAVLDIVMAVTGEVTDD